MSKTAENFRYARRYLFDVSTGLLHKLSAVLIITEEGG